MANTELVSVADRNPSPLMRRTDVEFVAKVSNANRCKLGAYEAEDPVSSDSG